MTLKLKFNNMRKALFILFLMVASLAVDAQVNFMGIPVDGTKNEMISKLRQKGFTYNQELNEMVGQFDGHDVVIVPVENHNKVYRIFVMQTIWTRYKPEIIRRFNSLYNRFYANENYIYSYGERIKEDENISYEMSIRNKRYECGFIQLTGDKENTVWFLLCESYGEYYIAIYYDNFKNYPNGEDL